MLVILTSNIGCPLIQLTCSKKEISMTLLEMYGNIQWLLFILFKILKFIQFMRISLLPLTIQDIMLLKEEASLVQETKHYIIPDMPLEDTSINLQVSDTLSPIIPKSMILTKLINLTYQCRKPWKYTSLTINPTFVRHWEWLRLLKINWIWIEP